jgi:hypothetical protein
VAVSFVGAGTFTESTSANPTVPYPSGLQANDVLVLLFGVNNATVPSTQTGFTTVVAHSSTGDTLLPALYMGIKFATGAESGSFTTTIAGTAARSLQMLAFRGVDLVNPQDVTASTLDKTQTTDANFDIPGVTTTQAGTALVYAAIQNAATGGMTPPTNPAAFTEDGDRSTGRNFSTGHLLWSGSGSTGTVTVVGNGSTRGYAGLLVLRPAATGAGDYGLWVPPGPGQGPNPLGRFSRPFVHPEPAAPAGSYQTIVMAAAGTAVSQQVTQTTIDLPYPAGITAGDFLVFYVGNNGASVTLPSGWSSMTGSAGSVAAGSNGSLLLAGKVADGSETGSLTVTQASAFAVGRMFRYTGVDQTTPQDTTATSTSSTTASITDPAITTVTPGAMEIAVAMSRTAGTITGPGGYTTENQNTTGNPSTLYLDQLDAAAGSTGTVAFTLPGASVNAAAVHAALRPAVATGGHTQLVGIAAETDAAIAAGRLKTRLANVAPETDTAVAIGRLKSRAVAAATETDAAQALGRLKTRLVAIASETETAVAVTRRKTRAAAAAVETDAAVALGRVKSRLIGIAVETDTAVRKAGVVLGAMPALETDTAVVVGRRKSRALGAAAETDSAQGLGRVKTRTVGIAAETDTAQALGRVKAKAVTASTETDSAQALGRLKARQAAAASEADTAVGLGRVSTKTIGAAPETDTAIALGKRKTRLVGTPVETDSTGTVTRPGVFAPTTETDTAQALGRAKTRLVGLAAEADSSRPIARARSITPAAETDTALTIARRKTRAVGAALEADDAQPIGSLVTPHVPDPELRHPGAAVDSHSYAAATATGGASAGINTSRAGAGLVGAAAGAAIRPHDYRAEEAP